MLFLKSPPLLFEGCCCCDWPNSPSGFDWLALPNKPVPAVVVGCPPPPKIPVLAVAVLFPENSPPLPKVLLPAAEANGFWTPVLALFPNNPVPPDVWLFVVPLPNVVPPNSEFVVFEPPPKSEFPPLVVLLLNKPPPVAGLLPKSAPPPWFVALVANGLLILALDCDVAMLLALLISWS